MPENRQENLSIFPKQMLILSGSALKVIACLIMLLDHSASLLLSQYQPALEPAFSMFGLYHAITEMNRRQDRPAACFYVHINEIIYQ